MSKSLLPEGLQHSRLPCPSPSPGACSNSCPLSQWWHPTISSCQPLLLLPSILPSIRVFSNESTLHIRWPSIRASASASVLPMNIQGWYSLGLTGLISCCAWDSQEFSPASQFKSISSSALSLLYGPTLTSVHDYWKTVTLIAATKYSSFLLLFLFVCFLC